MAIQKSAVTRRPIAGLSDPAVEHHLDASRLRGVTTEGPAEVNDPVFGAMASARARARNQTKAQKRKAEKDRERAAYKVTFDLTVEQKEFIQAMAAEHQCPPSHVAALMIEYAMDHWARIDIEGRKIRTRNYKYEWFLSVAGLRVEE